MTLWKAVENTCEVIGMQTTDVEAKNDTIVFFDEMDTVMISSRTADLVHLLESFVMLMAKGDRPVRRYFDSYSTPFHGFQKIVFNGPPVSKEKHAF